MHEISNYCTGCNACATICPKHCINLKKNEYGELVPVIDNKICINCQACRKVCPSNFPPLKNKPISVFAAKSKDPSICQNSTSGGLSIILAKEALSLGGVVYGTSMDGIEAKVVRICELDDLPRIQKSKYVQSHTYNALNQMKDDLIAGKKVVFLGSPCQLAGAKNFLRKYSDNLLLVDILCHGAPSQDCLKNGVELETCEKVKSIQFRDNNKYCLNIKTLEDKCISVPYRRSYWFNAFVEALIMREACYSCPYASVDRIGDITIGDFWGLGKKKMTNLDVSTGVNLVLVNTPKGWIAWEKIKSKLDCEERNIEEAIPYNHSLTAPAVKPKDYERFIALYAKYGGKYALLNAYKKKTTFVAIRRWISKREWLYNIVVKIPAIGNKIIDFPQ